jgi:hypothetical protein
MPRQLQITETTKNLPMELVNYILNFAPIRNPTADCIQRVIDVYNVDHSWYYTQYSGMYYIKHNISFSDYYWVSNAEYNGFEYGSTAYNNPNIIVSDLDTAF